MLQEAIRGSWLMADSDAPPPSHPLAAGSGLLITQVTRYGGRLANYSGGTAPDLHRISFSARDWSQRRANERATGGS